MSAPRELREKRSISVRFKRYLGEKGKRDLMKRKYPKPIKTHGTIEDAVSVDSFSLRTGALKMELWKTAKYFSYTEQDEVITLDNREWIKFKIKRISTVTGEQEYFICPKCGKKYRFLYIDTKAPEQIRKKGFMCRKCARLNYRSQQEFKDYLDYYDKGMEYAKEKFGWTYEDAYPQEFPYYTPDRPRYMHKSTYERYLKKFRWYQRKYKQGYDAEYLVVMGECRRHERRYLRR